MYNGEIKMRKLFFLMMCLSVSLFAFEPKTTGVLLLHGKTGTASKSWDSFQSYFERAGFVVLAKDMPWSKNRYIDKTYEASLQEVDDCVKELKAKGVKQIVVIGHSMGSNVALAYASFHPVDALVLLAPGHNPDKTIAPYKSSVDLAKSMIDEGKGSETASFADLNVGKQFTRQMRADVYYSFFSPDGLSAMSLRAKQLPQNTPVLYVVGKQDPLTEKNGMEIFDALPKTSKSHYSIVNADHMGTVNESMEEVALWIKAL